LFDFDFRNDPGGDSMPHVGGADTATDLEAKFWEYHAENPHVYLAFKRAALELLGAGVQHYGAGAIFEYLRFETAVRASGDTFKLNNNYRSRYSRLLAEEDARFVDFFEFRTLKT